MDSLDELRRTGDAIRAALEKARLAEKRDVDFLAAHMGHRLRLASTSMNALCVDCLIAWAPTAGPEAVVCLTT